MLWPKSWRVEADPASRDGNPQILKTRPTATGLPGAVGENGASCEDAHAEGAPLSVGQRRRFFLGLGCVTGSSGRHATFTNIPSASRLKTSRFVARNETAASAGLLKNLTVSNSTNITGTPRINVFHSRSRYWKVTCLQACSSRNTRGRRAAEIFRSAELPAALRGPVVGALRVLRDVGRLLGRQLTEFSSHRGELGTDGPDLCGQE